MKHGLQDFVFARNLLPCKALAGWWNGRHTGLKILCLEMGVRVRAPLRLLEVH
jgi:hypothetical protein